MILALALITILCYNNIYANEQLPSILPYITNLKNAEYIDGMVINDYKYENCFTIRQQGKIEFNTLDKKSMILTLKAPDCGSDIINTLIIYINGEVYYNRSSFNGEDFDLTLSFKPYSNIKITFNSMNKVTNLLNPMYVYILDTAI